MAFSRASSTRRLAPAPSANPAGKRVCLQRTLTCVGSLNHSRPRRARLRLRCVTGPVVRARRSRACTGHGGERARRCAVSAARARAVRARARRVPWLCPHFVVRLRGQVVRHPPSFVVRDVQRARSSSAIAAPTRSSSAFRDASRRSRNAHDLEAMVGAYAGDAVPGRENGDELARLPPARVGRRRRRARRSRWSWRTLPVAPPWWGPRPGRTRPPRSRRGLGRARRRSAGARRKRAVATTLEVTTRARVERRGGERVAPRAARSRRAMRASRAAV